jgi:hypothetical protein
LPLFLRWLRGIAVALVTLTATPAWASNVPQLTVGAGVFELVADREHAFEGDVTYRFGQSWFGTGGGVFGGIRPELGLMANSRGAVMGWAGVAAPFQWAGDAWEIAPSIGIGAYHRGQSKYLGGTFEFHLGLAVSHALTPHTRVGLAFMHISNGGVHDKNPGANAALVTWSWNFQD